MRQVKNDLKLDTMPDPCDYFVRVGFEYIVRELTSRSQDLIGGTSTGGIIAVLLGRLRLSIKECQKKYNDLSKDIFDEERFGSGVWQSRYDHTNLEAILKKALVEFKFNPEELMEDNHPRMCHT
jgi:patatin-like phospholipase/acyl hydrolase